MEVGFLIPNQMKCSFTNITPGRQTAEAGVHAAVGTGAPTSSRLSGNEPSASVMTEGNARNRLAVGAPGLSQGFVLDRCSNSALSSDA